MFALGTGRDGKELIERQKAWLAALPSCESSAMSVLERFSNLELTQTFLSLVELRRTRVIYALLLWVCEHLPASFMYAFLRHLGRGEDDNRI